MRQEENALGVERAKNPKKEQARSASPGPWTFQKDTTFSSLGDYRIAAADRISPAIVFGGITETLANAHLIAAAPDLLEALKAVVVLDQSIDLLAGNEDLAARITAAIAKAEGQ